MTLQEAKQHFRPELSSPVSRQVYQFVSDRRWVEIDVAHRVIGPVRRILPNGWDRIQQLQNPVQPRSGQTINIGSIETNGGQLAVGNQNSQTQHFGIEASDLATVLERLQEMRLEFPDDLAFDDIEAVLVSEEEPAESKRTALKWLRDIAVRATGSAAGQGLIEAISAVLG